MGKFDYQGAKKAGYSDEEILSHLSSQNPKFDISGARKAGYSPEEIVGHLANGKPQEEEQKYFGQEGSLVGGKVGRAIEAASERPSLVATELPIAGAKFIEQPIDAIESVLGGVQKLLGSNIKPPTTKNRPSDLLAEYVRSNLPEELHQGREDISDIESFLLPFIKLRGARKLPLAAEEELLTSAPSASKAVPPRGSKDSVQKMFEERTALSPQTTSEITEDLKNVGKSVKEKILGPNISEEIPKSISPERIKNTTSAGMDLEKSVGGIYKKLTAQERKAYDISKIANQAVEGIHPELVAELETFLTEAENIIDPSAPLKRYIESTRKILNEISERTPNGGLIGYKPISNQKLINQIQEYHQIPKYDFPTDTKTGIFKTLTNKLTEAVDRTAAKFPEANKAWKAAKRKHAEKADLFDPDSVSKWTKLADKKYSKEFISTINVDDIRQLEPVLKLSKEAQKLLQQMKRELVEKTLEENFSVGTRFDKKQIARKIAELEPVFTPEEIKVVEKLFEEAQTPGAKVASLGSKFLKYIRHPSSLVNEIHKIK